MYDYVVVGAGLTGSIIARELKSKGNKVLVIDKRNYIGGNCADQVLDNIPINRHGGHIFHTNDDKIWNYINQFSRFIPYQHRVKVKSKGKIYSFPINLLTLHQLWGVTTKEEAIKIIEEKKIKIPNPSNFEEKVLSLVGEEIYQKFFFGYSYKQWGKSPALLPVNLMSRIPIRFNYDDNYFDTKYQAMPEDGYTPIFEKLLGGIEVKLNEEYTPKHQIKPSKKIIYTGGIDEYYDYSLGKLEYRSVTHQYITYDLGCATMNHPDLFDEYTRMICFNYFYPNKKGSFITAIEYPTGENKDYPIVDKKNLDLYSLYKNVENNETIFTGRLGSYKYIDMDQAIGMALKVVRDLG